MVYRNKIYILKRYINVWHTTYNVTLVCVRIYKIIIILNKNCVYYLILLDNKNVDCYYQ